MEPHPDSDGNNGSRSSELPAYPHYDDAVDCLGNASISAKAHPPASARRYVCSAQQFQFASDTVAEEKCPHRYFEAAVTPPGKIRPSVQDEEHRRQQLILQKMLKKQKEANAGQRIPLPHLTTMPSRKTSHEELLHMHGVITKGRPLPFDNEVHQTKNIEKASSSCDGSRPRVPLRRPPQKFLPGSSQYFFANRYPLQAGAVENVPEMGNSVGLSSSLPRQSSSFGCDAQFFEHQSSGPRDLAEKHGIPVSRGPHHLETGIHSLVRIPPGHRMSKCVTNVNHPTCPESDIIIPNSELVNGILDSSAPTNGCFYHDSIVGFSSPQAIPLAIKTTGINAWQTEDSTQWESQGGGNGSVLNTFTVGSVGAVGEKVSKQNYFVNTHESTFRHNLAWKYLDEARQGAPDTETADGPIQKSYQGGWRSSSLHGISKLLENHGDKEKAKNIRDASEVERLSSIESHQAALGTMEADFTMRSEPSKKEFCCVEGKWRSHEGTIAMLGQDGTRENTERTFDSIRSDNDETEIKIVPENRSKSRKKRYIDEEKPPITEEKDIKIEPTRCLSPGEERTISSGEEVWRQRGEMNNVVTGGHSQSWNREFVPFDEEQEIHQTLTKNVEFEKQTEFCQPSHLELGLDNGEQRQPKEIKKKVGTVNKGVSRMDCSIEFDKEAMRPLSEEKDFPVEQSQPSRDFDKGWPIKHNSNSLFEPSKEETARVNQFPNTDHEKEANIKKKSRPGRPRKCKPKAVNNQLSVVFKCPHCMTDLHYKYAGTAKASFANHVRSCGSEKNMNTNSTKPLRNKQRSQNIDTEYVSSSSPSSEKFEGDNLSELETSEKPFEFEGEIVSEKVKGGVKNPANSGSCRRRKKNQRKKRESCSPPAVFRAKMETRGSRKRSIGNLSESYSKAPSPITSIPGSDHDPVENKAKKSPGMHIAEEGVIMGKRWREMTTREKKPLTDMAKKDKNRCSSEIALYSKPCNDKQKCSNERAASRKEKSNSSKRSTKGKNGFASEDSVPSTVPKLCQVERKPQIIDPQSSPMGHLWLEKSLSISKSFRSDVTSEAPNTDRRKTLVGRCWVWDEGHFVDDHFDPHTRHKCQQLEISLLKGGCTCASNHSLAMPISTAKLKRNEGKLFARSRRSERWTSTSHSSNIASRLASGQLDPHTLISCEDYEMGPEFRLIKDIHNECRVQPFLVRINPDVTFLADLHSHLCSSEIIGLLGGHYSDEEKCIYIQASFPCKSTDRADSGQTDVEMDPVGQVLATEAIANHGMSVVGWYHSHPDFQPNPSIVDLDNQASYQKLFQGDNLVGKSSISPFVGLIVGTYDSKNPTSQSVMRWFHVRQRDTSEGKSVNFPMNLRTTSRHYRTMTFENKITKNIRQSMTLHGKCIRSELESRFLSCPINSVQGFEVRNSTGGDHLGENTQMSDTTNRGVRNQASCINDKEPTSDYHPSSLLLTDSLLERTESEMLWKFPSARPLYFTEEERSMFEMEDDSIPYDVVAGIIWQAVEREQQVSEGSQISPCISASSRSVLELLLRQCWGAKSITKKLYSIIQGVDDGRSTTQDVQFDENDAALVHNIDAILSHYALKQSRINPSSLWNGAGDKGNRSKDWCGSDPWVDFYLTKILKSNPEKTEEGVYWGGTKMKRGQKIASCLLKWARNMQLGPCDNESGRKLNSLFDNSCRNDLQFDHEQIGYYEYGVKDRSSKKCIYFVAECMRLMAAKWREHGGW